MSTSSFSIWPKTSQKDEIINVLYVVVFSNCENIFVELRELFVNSSNVFASY